MAIKREKEERRRMRTSAREWANEQSQVFEPTAVKLPKDKKFLELRSGIMKLRVIPYHAGNGNPRADKGFEVFERKYFVYKIPMPDGKTRRYVASWDTFGKKDFVAEWVRLNGGTADKELLDSLRPQRRHLFNVIDVTDASERKKGIQVFDTTFGSVKYPAFGKMLADKITMSKKYDDFDDPENGFTVVIKVEDDSFPGGKFKRVTALDMEEPEEDAQLDVSIIEEAVCLDECLIETPYDEMKRIFLMGQGETDGQEEAPKSSPKKPSANGTVKAKREDEDVDPTADDLDIEKGSYVTYRKKSWKIVKVSGDGTSLTLEDDDGEQERGVAPRDVKLIVEEEIDEDELEEDEDDPPPARGAKNAPTKGTAGAQKHSSDDDDEDDEDEFEEELDEDEDEDEDEPAPRKKVKR